MVWLRLAGRPGLRRAFGPYAQSERRKFYVAALEQLRAAGLVYPCTCSRKDILTAARAPHAEDEREPIYPGTCRLKWPREIGVRPPVAGPPDRSRRRARDQLAFSRAGG